MALQIPVFDSGPDCPGRDQGSQDCTDQLQSLNKVHPAMMRERCAITGERRSDWGDLGDFVDAGAGYSLDLTPRQGRRHSAECRRAAPALAVLSRVHERGGDCRIVLALDGRPLQKVDLG